MLLKSGWFFLFLLTILQSARSKSVEADLIENEIKPDPPVVSSSSSRIISGWEAQPGQLPHHAALRMVNPTGGLRQCGGSIVSKEWVITSATCTVSRILAIVRAGVVSLTNPEYIFETTEWYNHPQYNNQSSSLQPFDISLMKLQRPVVYTRLVQPIRIQSKADSNRDYDGQQVYVSGHGRTETFGSDSDVLRWVYLRAISDDTCQRRYAMIKIGNTVCAQYYNVTSQNACFGDNGGPLVHVGSDGVPTLIGVAYFFPGTSNRCESGLPSGFIRPGIFLTWFEEVTGIDFEKLQEGDGHVNDTVTANTTTTVTIPTSTNPSITTPTLTTTSSSTPTSTVTEDSPSKETTTAQPEDSEDKEEEDLDGSESDKDDDIAQLLKRFQVDVKVKVRLDKFNVLKVVRNDTNVSKP